MQVDAKDHRRRRQRLIVGTLLLLLLAFWYGCRLLYLWRGQCLLLLFLLLRLHSREMKT
jgi:hypothetical protein